MLKIESNLKLNGRHWGLAFMDGIAYTANVALAAKLLLKGYVVTDQPEAEHINTKQTTSTTLPFPKQDKTDKGDRQPEAVPLKNTTTAPQPDAVQVPAITPAETTSSEPVESLKPKTTKPRKKVVTADAADKH